jgi:secreted trypsin-like serine protease
VALVAVLASIATASGRVGATDVATPDPTTPRSRPDTRIVGGTAAAPGAWPSQVALIDRAQGTASAGQFCGGTVIDRSWILTAAHCVRDPGDWTPSPSQIDVLVGTSSLSGGGTRIRAVEFRVHPGWRPADLRNDVALIRLDRPVPNGTPIQALAAASDGAAGVDAVATGWGALDDPPTTPFPSGLRQVTMDMASDAQCRAVIPSIFDAATQTCAWRHGKGICFGDSGGPLVVDRDGQFVQVGISSYVLVCGEHPSYFTQVSSFATWIRWQVRYGPQPNANTFVRRQYLDLFGRQPTGSELFSGVAALEDGQSTAGFVANLLDGKTYSGRSGGVARLYRAIFLRAPDTSGMTYWMREITRGVSLKRIADLMVRVPEFVNRYGDLDHGEFVDLVYDNVLGWAPSARDRGYWVGELQSGRRTRGTVMVGFSESAEYRATWDPTTRAIASFWGLVRRVPSPAESATWIGRSTGDTARFLLASWSYANRF